MDASIMLNLRPYTESYITSNIFSGEACKGLAHWKICELLCEHVTGHEYTVKQGGLMLFIHKITTSITDHLDTAIGLPYSNSFILKKTINVKKYGEMLATCLIELIDSQDSEEFIYHTNMSLKKINERRENG